MSDTDIPSEQATQVVDWRALRDLVSDDTGEQRRRRRSVALTVTVVAWLAAAVLIWTTWDQIAARNVVADQLPWLASGGLGAIVLAIVGGASLVVAFLPADESAPRGSRPPRTGPTSSAAQPTSTAPDTVIR
ncbi:MAG: hypothetical protein S0880_24005 [Actinomycetota bacterium]|nr:hypothetical protein [Actinomycetota bacterium]